jgi:cell division protein FtsW
MEKNGRPFPADHFLTASVFLLVGLGLVVLYSASWVPAERISRIARRDYSFIRLQVFFALMALPLFFLASRIKPDFFRRRGVLLLMLILTALLCVLPLFERIGGNKNGASRWINLTLDLGENRKVSFQPSELIKLALPLYLAHFFDKKRERLDEFAAGILPPALVTLGFAALICLQNNFSTALFIVLNALFIFYLAGIRIRYFAGAVFIVLPLAVLLLLTGEHRMNRLITWWSRGDRDPLGGGYQIINSLNVINSGGFWGKGIGQGTGKLTSVPEVQSDFIFAAYAEETGFLGVLLFFCLIAFFAFRAYRTALGQEDPYRKFLAAGLATSIISQTLINLAVAADTLPTTGIPLPFFSHGGSSLVITLIMAGLLINLSRTSRYSAPREAFSFRPGPGAAYRGGEDSYAG